MVWSYQQSSGKIFLDGALVDKGYSGNGKGLNNPAAQEQACVGPIPQGSYTIGPPRDPPDLMGVLALSLTPDPANQMFGRTDFFIHGDNDKLDYSASEGCIILSLATRRLIDAGQDKSLIVVA